MKTHFAYVKPTWAGSQGMAEVNRRKTACVFGSIFFRTDPGGECKWWPPCLSNAGLLLWETESATSTSTSLVGMFLPSLGPEISVADGPTLHINSCPVTAHWPSLSIRQDLSKEKVGTGCPISSLSLLRNAASFLLGLLSSPGNLLLSYHRTSLDSLNELLVLRTIKRWHRSVSLGCCVLLHKGDAFQAPSGLFTFGP